MLGLRKRARDAIPTPEAGAVYLTVDSDGLLVFKKEDGSFVAPETLIAELGDSSADALASAVTALTTAIGTKQDASSAATDTELVAEKTAREGADTTNAAAVAAAKATADAALSRGGGTMTGKITLDGDPSANLHPATRQYVTAQIAAVIDGAPGALDTLKEISDQLSTDESAVAALTATVSGKLTKTSNLSDVADAATARGNLSAASIASVTTEKEAREAADGTEKSARESAINIINLGTDWSDGDLVLELSGSTGNVGKRMDLRHGTTASPVTGDGSSIRVSRTEKITQAEHNAFAGASAGGQTTETAAFSAASIGLAGSEVQVQAANFSAQNLGTAGQPDACAVRASAWQRTAGSGVAIASYMRARNDLPGGMLTVLELQAQNLTGAFSEVSNSAFSKVSGLAISAGSSFYEGGGAGIQFHHPTGWPQLDVGIHAISGNGGPLKSAFLRDNSEAAISLDVRGKHATAAVRVLKEGGCVLVGAEALSETTSQLLEINAGGVSKNPLVKLTAGGTGLFNIVQQFNAGGANFNIGQIGTAGSLMTGTAVGDTTFALATGKILHIGKGAAAAVFKASETGVGFYGKAPVARPNVKAASEVTAKELCEALETLGLVE